MAKRKLIYEGKTKVIYEGPEPGTCIQHYKDDTAAFIAQKSAKISGKGVLNNRISAHLMTRLEAMGIPTHFLRSLNMREQLVKKLEMVPLKIVVRNIAAGAFASRVNVAEGTTLQQPLIEYYYKNSPKGADALVNENHIYSFGWADFYELEELTHLAFRVNDYLSGLFAGIGLQLVDFKLEFGRLWGEYGELYLFLSDEVSPDCCRLWELDTAVTSQPHGAKAKQKPGRPLGYSIADYQLIAERLGLIPKGGIITEGHVDERLASSLGEIENELAKKRRLRDVSKSQPRKA